MTEHKLRVTPGTSVNGISFNADIREVRAVFGKPKLSIKKAFFSKTRTDVYDDFHVFYSNEGKFVAIEVFGDVSVLINDETVFPGTVTKAIQIIPELSGNHEFFTSKSLSVGISTDEEGKMIKSILFGCIGYYR